MRVRVRVGVESWCWCLLLGCPGQEEASLPSLDSSRPHSAARQTPTLLHVTSNLPTNQSSPASTRHSSSATKPYPPSSLPTLSASKPSAGVMRRARQQPSGGGGPALSWWWWC